MSFDLLAPPTIQTEVIAAFRAVLATPDLELDLYTPLDTISGWDSMSHVALMAELECRFGLTLERGELEALQSVGDVVRTFGAKRILRAA